MHKIHFLHFIKCTLFETDLNEESKCSNCLFVRIFLIKLYKKFACFIDLYGIHMDICRLYSYINVVISY